MKKLFIAGVVAALSLCSGARASSQGQIHQAFEYPVVNPEDGYVEMAYGMFMVAGYAFDCHTGVHPLALMITAQRLSIGSPQIYVPQTIQLYPNLYRPDVQTLYASTCPAVSDHAGYAAHVSPPLPPGYWRVDVTWASEPFSQHTVSKIVEVGPQ